MAQRTGVGLRLPHLQQVATVRPDAAWFEIHPENFLANPHATEMLLDLANDYPISVHSVGVSVGSAHGLDADHLARVQTLVEALDPMLVSGHLAWSTHPGEYLNDLLPLPYDDDTLGLVARHVAEVQDAIGRPYLVENPSSYVGFRQSTLAEAQFLTELVRRTGCQLLCDVSNVHVSAHNMGYDARAYLDALPAEAIAELHLGGWTEEPEDGADRPLLIDTHGAAVDAAAIALYRYAITRFGSKPTLLEWDNEVPGVDVLLAEARRIDAAIAPHDDQGASRATC